jgi:hypothetical protein
LRTIAVAIRDIHIICAKFGEVIIDNAQYDIKNTITNSDR